LLGPACRRNLNSIPTSGDFQYHCSLQSDWGRMGSSCAGAASASVFRVYQKIFEDGLRLCPMMVVSRPFDLGSAPFTTVAAARLPTEATQTAFERMQRPTLTRGPFQPISNGGQVVLKVIGDVDTTGNNGRGLVPITKHPTDAGSTALKGMNVRIDLANVGEELVLDCKTGCSAESVGVRLPNRSGTRGFLKRTQVEVVPPLKVFKVGFGSNEVVPEDASLPAIRDAVSEYRQLGDQGGGLRITTAYREQEGRDPLEDKLKADTRASSLRRILTALGVAHDHIAADDRIRVVGQRIGKEPGQVPEAVIEIMRAPR